MLHELGGEAFSYIEEECSHGGPLGKGLTTVPLTGEVAAILPAATSATDLLDFGSGDVAAGDEVEELAHLIADQMAGRSERICVFEDPTARADDPARPELPTFTVVDRVYPFVSSDSGYEAIVAAARATHWYPSIGLVSAVEPGQELPAPDSSQTEGFLATLVERAQMVIIGAYDGESWLVWHPAGGDVAT